jgi:hypothetical protein
MRYRSTLTKGLAVLAMAQLCAMFQPMPGQTAHSYVHDRDVYARLDTNGRSARQQDTPIWSGRALVGYDYNRTAAPIVYTIDQDGNREDIALNIPEAGLVMLHSIAGGADGAIAVSGSAFSSNAQGTTFILWISPNRKTQIVTRVSPYAPEKIVIAGDGTIWTVGTQYDDAVTKSVANNQLRHFDTSGRQLASFLVHPKSPSRKGMPPVTYSRLVASADRIGWFTNGNQYIEFSLDGTELNRFEGPADLVEHPEYLQGVGLSADNELAIGVVTKPGMKYFALDRQTRTWSAILPIGKRTTMLGGFDGNTLITLPSFEDSGVIRRHIRSDGSSAQQPQTATANGK